MIRLWLFTGAAVLVSFAVDRDRTIQAILMTVKKIRRITPAILTMLILVSVTLYLLPEEVLSRFLVGRNLLAGTAIASALGSITLMPGFIVFPLSGILLKEGVPYMVLSALTTTMMMVGVVTFPIEREYFGTKVALVRNAIGFLIAVFVAVAMGLVYGELVGGIWF